MSPQTLQIIETVGLLLNWTGLALSPLLVTPLLFLVFGGQGFARLLQRLSNGVDRVNKRIAAGVVWLSLAMALTQFAIVILRYVFGLNFIWLQESMTYMHGALFLLLGGYVLLTDDHVRVDIFYREASPGRKALVNLVGVYGFLMPMCLIAIWMAGPYVARSWAIQEGSAETSGIQAVFLLKSLIPAFATLLIAQGFSLAARSALVLTGRTEGTSAAAREAASV
ncbi:MAG: TRAP transporter small permease subunit [Pseudomonadota bacterium]